MAGLTNGTNGIDSDGGIRLPEAESEAVLAEKEEVGILTSPINVPPHASCLLSLLAAWSLAQVAPVEMNSDPIKEAEPSPPSTSTAPSRPKTSGGRKPMKAKRNPELSRENSEEAPKVNILL